MEIRSAYRERNQMVRGDFKFGPLFDFHISGEGSGLLTTDGEMGMLTISFDLRDKAKVVSVLQDVIAHIDDIEDLANEAAPFYNSVERDKFHRLLANGQYDLAIELSRGDQEILDYINSYGQDD